MLKKAIIIIILLVLIVSPRIMLGFRNETIATQAMIAENYELAAENFELAAKRLFWRASLWEMLGFASSSLEQDENAIMALEMARQKEAISDVGMDLLGQHLWSLDCKEDAYVIWQEGLEKFPDHFAFYNHLAMYYHDIGDKTAEQDAIERWLDYGGEADSSAAFHYRLGLLLTLPSPEDALDEFLFASRLDNDFAPAVETLRTSLNLASLESDPAEKRILLGRGLALVNEWQLAAEIFTSATQADSESASALAWLGEAKQHIDKNPLPDLDKALSLEPNSTLVRSLRSLYWRREGDFASALREIRVVVNLEAEDPHWQAELAELLALSGDLPPALAAYEKALSLAPNDPVYWHLLARFSVQYSVRLADVGLPAVEKALALDPENALYLDTLGWIYLELGQHESAEEALLRALELDPNLASAHLHLGLYYLSKSHQNLAYPYLVNARDFAEDNSVKEQARRLLEVYFQE